MKKEKEPRQESASFFNELGSFMQPYKGLYAASVVISVLGVAAHVASYAFAGLVAAALFAGQYQNILWLLIAAGLGRLAYAVLCNVSTWCSHKAAYRTLRDVRSAMAAKMLRLPMGYFETRGSGRLKTLITDQVENMEKPLAHVLPELTGNLIAPAALLLWMFFVDWRLALCSLVWIVAGFSVTGGMMKNYPEKFAGQLKAQKAMNQAVTEYVNGIEVIKNFGRADSCGQKYEEAVYGHAAYNVNWQRETQVYSALGMAIAPFSVFPVLLAGIFFYARGTLEAPVLVLCVLLTMGIFGPLMQTAAYMDQLAQMGTVAKELKGILDYPELARGEGAEPKDTSVALEQVTFCYNEADRPALCNVSLQVPPGSMLALVGPSGSGKSTVAKLLAGYWDASEGRVLLGGVPISRYTQQQLNSLVSFVDQDTFLFNKTIRDNIRLGVPNAGDEEVTAACKRAGCHSFISALPQGYDTLAGTAGSMLSGGEKQRIAIARAMMKNTPILILDEATASADPENEALIQSALSAAAAGKTLIVVAHHLSTIVKADQIAYVEKGCIKALGTHERLLESSPEYAALWALSKEG